MKGIIIVILVLILGVGAWWYLKPMGTTSKTEVTTKTPNTNTTAGAKTIEIKNFAYAPGTLTVKAGEKVNVVNMDAAGHTVTADDGSFDTGILSQGEDGTFTAPTTPGTYTFHCTPHPSITGTLIVN